MPNVRRLVTLADVDGPDDAVVSVSALHEAELDDGSRVLLLDDRGWGSSGRWADSSAERVREFTRTVVGPDEPPPGRSRADMAALHWDTLRRTMLRAGIVVDAAELARLPHDVLLSPRLLARLDPAAPG
ncbi:hypothetical protein CFN78_10335 [Amycolatopsis antarctica]|uniref:Uncharacterized protein n=1 Tax=Amycolatopsis antarctica TaxID=1854586 RepID=A0A263D463_9PSEU|nr:hypothetical protein [Amycolatopsis antarctica]OZM73253.1 hypothetical protein CFN78_10335 [Amycolatopsis antarctica]